MKLNRLPHLAGLAAGWLLAAAITVPAQAEDKWPTQPIEMVCATDAASGAGNWCRLFAELVGKELGTRIEVLFKGGGGGNTAAEYVAKKPADGYTWLQRNTSYAAYMNLPTFKPDPMDFEVVVEVEKFLYLIGVKADSKYKTFQDLLADMKANPGKISFATNKPGSIHHQHLINLFKAFDVKWNFVPYQGAGAAMKDVLGGHVPVGIVTGGPWSKQVKAGKGRSLLLLNEEPFPGLDAPTPKSLGKDYKMTHQVQGMFVKRGTPDAVKKKIAVAFKKATESEGYKNYVKSNVGVVPQFRDDSAKLTAEFHAIRNETRDYLRQAGLIK